MAIGEVCTRQVFVTDRATTIADAAQMMRENHVGNLVIVDTADGQRIPAGIVTDRDIVISVVAKKVDASVYTVGDLVTRDLVTARENQGLFETLREMRTHGVRRMPVVNAGGVLVGIIAVDDIIQLLAEEMTEIGKIFSHEHARETRTRL